jgi:hypothetical protein
MIGSVLLGGGMFLAGCSASSNSGASSSEAARQADGQAAAATAPGKAATPGSAFGNTGGQGGASTTARLAPASSIIYTAQLTVRAGDVSSAAAQAAQIADGVGGYVSSETAKVNPDHPSEATASVQLKIPVAAYPATLGQLGHRLGTQLSLQQQAQDVTQQVADVDSQVASDRAAIAQLRALLSHAGSVGELLSVQNQINSEEANLESMQAQQRALSRQTSYATVTLTILGPKAKPVLHRQKPPTLAGGFTVGWHALRIAVSWTLGVPRRDRAVRRRPGRRRVPGLPRAALAGPSQAGRRARLAGELAGTPGFRTGREPTRRAPGRPAWPVRPGRFPAARRDRG